MMAYDYSNSFKNSKKIKETRKLRKKYIEANMPRWKEEAMPYVVAREVSRLTAAKIGEMVGTSEHVIKKFEKGEPIERSKLVTKSYATALNLIYSKKFGITSDNLSKLYSPNDLLEIFVNLNGGLGISLLEDAISRVNRLYKFNWVIRVDKFSKKPVNERCTVVYDEDNGNYFHVI